MGDTIPDYPQTCTSCYEARVLSFHCWLRTRSHPSSPTCLQTLSDMVTLDTSNIVWSNGHLPQLSLQVLQDGGDGVLRVDLHHLSHRLRHLRPRLLPPRLPARHDGRHQLQLGVWGRVSLWRRRMTMLKMTKVQTNRLCQKKRREIFLRPSFTFSSWGSEETWIIFAPEMPYIFLNSEMPFICFIQFAWKISQTYSSLSFFLFSNLIVPFLQSLMQYSAIALWLLLTCCW